MKKYQRITLTSSLVVAVLAVGVSMWYTSGRNAQVVATVSDAFKKNQIVYSATTVLEFDSEPGYPSLTETQLFIANIDRTQAKVFYTFQSGPYPITMYRDGKVKVFTDIGEPFTYKYEATTVDLDGTVLSKSAEDLEVLEVTSSDGRYRAKTAFTANPKPADGELLKFFQALVVTDLRDGKEVARFTLANKSSTSAYLEPKAFAEGELGLYFIERPYRPQEIGTPYSLYYQPLSGERQLIYSSPSAAQPPYTAYEFLTVLPKQQQVIAWAQQIDRGWVPGKLELAVYDIDRKTWQHLDIPCDTWTILFRNSQPQGVCTKETGEILAFDAANTTQPVDVLVQSAQGAYFLGFSKNGQFLAYTTTNPIDAPMSSEASNFNVNTYNAQHYLMRVFIVDTVTKEQLQVLESVTQSMGQRVGDVTYQFLGFVDS